MEPIIVISTLSSNEDDVSFFHINFIQLCGYSGDDIDMSAYLVAWGAQVDMRSSRNITTNIQGTVHTPYDKWVLKKVGHM